MLDFLVGNDFLSAVVAFGLVLIPAIIIHELGHLFAAKSVGITILEFGVGIPPRAAKLFSWGETEFTLNWIPLGGFVRPLGEDMIRPMSAEETEKEREALLEKMSEPSSLVAQADRQMEPKEPEYANEREELAARGITDIKSVNDVRPLSRIIFMIAGPIANLFSAFLIFAIVGLAGVEVETGRIVFLATLPADSMFVEAGLQNDDFIETVDGQAFQSNREMFAYLAESSGEDVTLSVLRFLDDNSEERFDVNLTVDPAEAQALTESQAGLLVTSIQEGSPSDMAGIQPGDVIVGQGGTSLSTSDDPFGLLQTLNQSNEGIEVSVSIIREGDTIELSVTPRINPGPGQGHLGAGVLPQFVSAETGVRYRDAPLFDYQPLPIGDALVYGVDRITEIFSLIIELPARLIQGQAQPEEGRIISIVGVSQLGGEFLQQSIAQDRPVQILEYIALISIALGITNLLPIPPLDGGRILLIVIEMVRGRPMSQRREEVILLIGIAFILSLSIFVIINDILNPLTDLLP